MNAENTITIKYVRSDDARLPSVIYGSIGNPSKNKILEVIGSYKHLDHKIIGAFISYILVGALGLCKNKPSYYLSPHKRTFRLSKTGHWKFTFGPNKKML